MHWRCVDIFSGGRARAPAIFLLCHFAEHEWFLLRIFFYSITIIKICKNICSLFPVVLLKDRMYQLRNRYNLEKRKVESLRSEGLINARSTWPLFGNLNFLDGHIRPRKSYKSLMRRSRSPIQLSTRRSQLINKQEESGKSHYNSAALQQIMQIKYEDGGSHHGDNDVVMYQTGYDT